MLDKELFFSLCEKYNVELSKTAKTPMIRDAEGVHAITEEDVKQILTPPQKELIVSPAVKNNRFINYAIIV